MGYVITEIDHYISICPCPYIVEVKRRQKIVNCAHATAQMALQLRGQCRWHQCWGSQCRWHGTSQIATKRQPYGLMPTKMPLIHFFVSKMQGKKYWQQRGWTTAFIEGITLSSTLVSWKRSQNLNAFTTIDISDSFSQLPSLHTSFFTSL